MTQNAVVARAGVASRAAVASETDVKETDADGHRENWRELAACLHAEPELFFPVFSGDRSRSQVECAQAICAACPVRRECLRFALLTRQSHGVWGGIELTTSG